MIVIFPYSTTYNGNSLQNPGRRTAAGIPDKYIDIPEYVPYGRDNIPRSHSALPAQYEPLLHLHSIESCPQERLL